MKPPFRLWRLEHRIKVANREGNYKLAAKLNFEWVKTRNKMHHEVERSDGQSR